MTERAQRRGRAIAMTAAEVDEFLAAERTCRVATAGPDGRPHVAPLWFVWDGKSLWLSSLVRSQRWTDLMRDPRVAVIVDAGVEYSELRGVELSGAVAPVGDVPRTADARSRPGRAGAAVRRQVHRRRRGPARRSPRVAPAHPGKARQLGLP